MALRTDTATEAVAIVSADGVAREVETRLSTRRKCAFEHVVEFESMHSAFLVHDDLIDRDFVRRGLPTVTSRFAERARSRGLSPARAEVWATAAAVLAGANTEAIDRLGEFGRQIGIAFQLTEELHGVFGDPNISKKEPPQACGMESTSLSWLRL